MECHPPGCLWPVPSAVSGSMLPWVLSLSHMHLDLCLGSGEPLSRALEQEERAALASGLVVEGTLAQRWGLHSSIPASWESERKIPQGERGVPRPGSGDSMAVLALGRWQAQHLLPSPLWNPGLVQGLGVQLCKPSLSLHLCLTFQMPVSASSRREP